MEFDQRLWQLLALLQSQRKTAPRAHAEYYRLRDSTTDPEAQRILAPMEHQAFAREWTQENPMIAAPSLAVAIPAYTAAKALGVMKTRSGASLDEMMAGYRGLWQGLTGGNGGN